MAEAAAVEESGPFEGDPVIQLKTKVEHRERPWQQVKLPDDDRILMVREPKSAYFLDVALRSTSDDEAVALQAVDDILYRVFDEDSREHLRARIDDDDDDFDIDALGGYIEELQELWGKGRGGSAKSSAASSRRRTTRSTARRR